MNKDEIFLIIFLYSLVILIGSARSVLIPFFNEKRTSPIFAARAFIMAKAPKRPHHYPLSKRNTASLDPALFQGSVSITQKAAVISRSSRG